MLAQYQRVLRKSIFLPTLFFSHLCAVNLVGVVVYPLKRLPDGDGDDVRHDGHQQALDRQIADVVRKAADPIDLNKISKHSNQRD